MSVSSIHTVTPSSHHLVNNDESLNKMLSVIRKHLDMDVAFYSEFVSGQRIFRAVSKSEQKMSAIEVGDSDPIEETYCGKMSNGEFDNIIHDAKKHEGASKLDVTERLGIGAYMGVPITLSDGSLFGTLCCYKSEKDSSLRKRDLGFLNAFAEIYRDLFEERMQHTCIIDQMAESTLAALERDLLTVNYQPVYSLENNLICGYESLARFNSQPYRPPNIWFDEAEHVGMGEALQIKAIGQALRDIKRMNSHAQLSLNIAPEYILNGAIHRVLDGVDTSRLILEVTEHSPIEDYEVFRAQLAPLRERGVQLAIDDAGAGYASFQHILELEADLIKLDLSLIRDIHLQPKKYALAKALCTFATATSCVVVAEGVEVIEELRVLEKLGVDRIQGYLTGKPMPIEEAVLHQYSLPL